MMLRLHISCPTGKQVEVVAGPDDSVAKLKAALDEREGTAPGHFPLFCLRKLATRWPSELTSTALPEETRLLHASIADLPPENTARAAQLTQWLSTVDIRTKGSVGHVPSLLHDEWTLKDSGLADGDHLHYGPWCAEPGTDILRRTGRTATEQRRKLHGLLARRKADKFEDLTLEPEMEPEPEPEPELLVEPVEHGDVSGPAVVGSRSSGAAARALSDKLGLLLRQAAHRGFKHEVVKQLEAGAPVDDPAEGDRCTALMIAATRGVAGHGPDALQPQAQYNELLVLLLERGADPNRPDARGWTAMHKAASVGNLFALRAMRSNRPIVRQGRPNQQDRRGWTCLHWAKTAETAQVLLDEMGAKGDIKNVHGMSPEAMHYKRAASQGNVAAFFAARREEINKNKKPWED